MKINEDSRRIVLDALRGNGRISVRDVTDLIGVSEATARRLFVKLERDGQVVRTFGGIQLLEAGGPLYSFSYSARRMIKEKNAIGEAAAREVSSDDRIFLDSGTTVLAMARALARRIEGGELKGVRVVTNSLILADQLSGICKLVFVGGEIRAERKDACGVLAEELLKKLHVKKAFLGCDACDYQSGLMTTDERTARMNEIIIGNASLVYILADAHKIGETSFVSYGSLDQVDAFIVDAMIGDDQRKSLEALVPRLIIA
jgi:DeoR/GlpR family transcriptional regulator of sugar metabolism